MHDILIAGGGSGGHVAPAIAVAESLQTLDITTILVHSGRKVDLEMVENTSFAHESISAAPFRMNPLGLFHFYKQFLKATKEAKEIIKSHEIKCVLSTGGFVAAPALRAANALGIPTILLNLDNPAGKANRFARRWANQLLTTVDCGWKDATRVNVPLRNESVDHLDPETCKEQLGLDPRLSTLLVTGASQGAKTINELIPALAKQSPLSFKGWQILHIAGERNKEEVSNSWGGIDVPVQVVGFLHEMGIAWGAADLAITRGGANTIAEIALHAVPTVVLPYPFHKDDHQRTNALPLANIKGIVLAYDFRTTQKNLQEVGTVIKRLLDEHILRLKMRQALTSLHQTNGADDIAQLCKKHLLDS